MIKVKTLALSVSAALAWGAIGSAHAATTTQQVADLKAQVAELQEIVQALSGEQRQQAVQLRQQAEMAAAKPAPVAPVASSSKPGWMTLPDGKTQVKLYGSVRVDATYDTKGGNASTTNVNNNTNNVPLNSANATQGNLNVTAATSRIGLDIVRPTERGDLIGKIEADFMGSNGTNGDGSFRVRHAYMSLNNWLAGQTTSPFVNADTMPETVDFNGAMGGGTKRTVQVRYTQPLTANQKLLVALEGGSVDNFSGTSQTTGGGRFPALTARYDITTADKKALVQVHGLAHENRVSTNDSNDETKMAWGLGIGAKYSLTPHDTVFANYYHVKGDNRYMLYSDNSYAVTGSPVTGFNVYQSESDSGLIGYAHKWSPQWRSTVAAGAIWYKSSNDFAAAAPTQNKTLYNVLANSFYSPVPGVDLGIEYTYGQREDFNTNKGDYSRVGLMAKYNF